VTVPLTHSSGSYFFPQTSTTSIPPLNRSLYNANSICPSPPSFASALQRGPTKAGKARCIGDSTPKRRL